LGLRGLCGFVSGIVDISHVLCVVSLPLTGAAEMSLKPPKLFHSGINSQLAQEKFFTKCFGTQTFAEIANLTSAA